MSSSLDESAIIRACKALLLLSPLLFLTVILMLPSSEIHYYPLSQKLVVGGGGDDHSGPTDLSHLVFGVLGSEKAWHHRKAYVESWWRPNATVGLLLLDKEPTGDLLPWSPFSPPYRVSDDVNRIMRETKHRNKRVARMVHGIMEVVRDAPQPQQEVRWVVMADEDTVLLVDNLVALLAGLDHRKLYYLGGHSEFILSNYWFSFQQAFGGGGIVLSYPLARALSHGIMGCLKRYQNLNSADKTCSYCIADLGVSLSPQHGFHQIDMRGDISGFLSHHPNTPLISLHHFDYVNPIFPSMDRAQSVGHLMNAANLDQTRILQQIICFHRQSNWSFSISWGYSANIYEKIMPRSYLQNPIQSFKPWLKSPGPPHWIFDVRRLRAAAASDPCLVPHAFFLESTEKVAVTHAHYEILGTYRRSWRRGLPACSAAGISSSADRISKILVYSPATEPKQRQHPKDNESLGMDF
ncbi:unnamed protein product [Cuscuta campestris]|uniref:Uncharacterized protein n=1 Tax=Cuscuta campestris TaxID=132261 RepID=A0A484NP26_9ASTE|nr:unnamed protein product [Cuscuta campestris]